jgi:hypothetical protein
MLSRASSLHGAAAGERLFHDRPRGGGRDRDQAWPQQAPGNRITAHLKNGGTLEKAAVIANHASTRTTQLYDRRRDELSLDEVERIVI